MSRRNAETYRSMPSVREILLLDSRSVRAELMRRGEDRGWPEKPIVAGATDTLELIAIGFCARMAEVYRATGVLQRQNPP
jgi:Uma2 family endonuclease